jgi:hypothetical protein
MGSRKYKVRAYKVVWEVRGTLGVCYFHYVPEGMPKILEKVKKDFKSMKIKEIPNLINLMIQCEKKGLDGVLEGIPLELQERLKVQIEGFKGQGK